MNFLRRRGENVERTWMSDRYTAKERADALHVLTGSVVIVRHPYQRHPQSGAGNCWCGRHQGAKLHRFMAGEVPGD